MYRELLFGGAEIDSDKANLGLAILRVIAGLSMAFGHGIGKIPPSSGLVAGTAKLGFPLPEFFAWAAAFGSSGRVDAGAGTVDAARHGFDGFHDAGGRVRRSRGRSVRRKGDGAALPVHLGDVPAGGFGKVRCGCLYQVADQSCLISVWNPRTGHNRRRGLPITPARGRRRTPSGSPRWSA